MFHHGGSGQGSETVAEETVYVELGAGKGMLSLAVAQCVGGEGRVVLVDRDDVAAHSRLDKTIAVLQ